MSLNSVVYQGNITKDLDLKYGQSGTAVLSFSIGVSRDFVDKQTGNRESDFINCRAFGKTAELIAEHFQKGAEIIITGRTQTGNYENQQGQRVYTNDCVVNTFNFTRGSRQGGQQSNQKQSKNNQGGNFQQDSMPGLSKNGYNTNADPFGGSSQMNINDDDLPF